MDVTDQLHVQLQDVRLKVCQQCQLSVARAEIVDGRQQTMRAVLAEDVLQVPAIDDALAFCDFENDARERRTDPGRSFKGAADAVLRLVDRAWYEVDRHRYTRVLRAQRSSHLDCTDTAGLIKGVEVLWGKLLKHSSCAFPVGASDQSFLREDRARRKVDDRLEGHRKLDRSGCVRTTLRAARAHHR